MKRPLVLAALLAAGSFGTANAQTVTPTTTAPTVTPTTTVPTPNVTENLQLTVTNTGAFTTNANTSSESTQPSTVQYNSSQGQNNNFAVGANTSFGVSSSASSTPDYSVSTSAFLNSADTGTTLRNQIGTSGAAQAASSWASASGTYAQGYSNELVSTATDTFKVNGGWEYKGVVYEDKAAFEFAYKNSTEYKNAYSEAFNSAYSNFSGQGSNSSSSAVGTISGSFESSTNGSTSLASGSSSSGSSAASEAKTLYVADTKSTTGYREATAADYGSGAAIFAQNSSTNTDTGVTQISYSAASSVDVAKSATAAVNASANQGSTNKVVVTGIGSDAIFQSSANTTFEVAVESNLGKVNANAVTSSGTTNGNTTTSDTAMGVTSTSDQASKSALILLQGDGRISSSATANGSANGSFGTNSTASSNSASYTSVFFQAF